MDPAALDMKVESIPIQEAAVGGPILDEGDTVCEGPYSGPSCYHYPAMRHPFDRHHRVHLDRPLSD